MGKKVYCRFCKSKDLMTVDGDLFKCRFCLGIYSKDELVDEDFFEK